MIKKAIVLFSGGLDSRLTAKLLEKQGFEIHLVFVNYLLEEDAVMIYPA